MGGEGLLCGELDKGMSHILAGMKRDDCNVKHELYISGINILGPWLTDAVESEISDRGNYVVAKEQCSDLEWQVAVSLNQGKKIKRNLKLRKDHKEMNHRQEQHANAKACAQHGNPNT